MKNSLTGHQIDVIRRTINGIAARKGECPCATLASTLIKTGKTGFRAGDWCGYGQLRLALEDYPKFFALYFKDGDPTQACVRVVGDNTQTTEPTQAAGPFRPVFTPQLCNELIGALNLTGLISTPDRLAGYLDSMFRKVSDEDKLVSNNLLLVWQSGLFRNGTDPVLFYVTTSDIVTGNRTPGWCTRQSETGRYLIGKIGNIEPERPSFGNEAFDPSREIILEVGHIIENFERFPDDITEALKHDSFLNHHQVPDIDELPLHYYVFLEDRITGAVNRAIQQLKNGTAAVAPYWNFRARRKCWLIPLQLGLNGQITNALTLTPDILNGREVYWARTILTLSDAADDARLLGEITCPWLKDVI